MNSLRSILYPLSSIFVLFLLTGCASTTITREHYVLGRVLVPATPLVPAHEVAVTNELERITYHSEKDIDADYSRGATNVTFHIKADASTPTRTMWQGINDFAQKLIDAGKEAGKKTATGGVAP